MAQVVVERHIDLSSDRTPLWCAVGDTVLEIAAHGADSAAFHVAEDGIEPKSATVKPHAALHVTQTKGDERHVKLERLEWASRAATAHLVRSRASPSRCA